MKAIVCTRYGPPEALRLQEVPKPVPGKNDILIKILASSVTMGDSEMRRFDIATWIWLPLRLYMGVFKPRMKIYGQELAGVVEEVGSRVTRFKTGDTVFAPTQMRLGAHAEYVCLPENYAIAEKPARVSFEQAAVIPTGGLNALHFVRKANIKKGENVLINGAGGCIGTYAVQLAKLAGAEVTCVDSQPKLGMLQAIGADAIIDYEKEDFTHSGKKWDVIIDIVCKGSFSKAIGCLKANGRYVLGNPTISGMIRGVWVSKTTDKSVFFELAPYKSSDLTYLAELVASGKVMPVIDRIFPLGETANAHRYVDTGCKKGSVVISVAAEK